MQSVICQSLLAQKERISEKAKQKAEDKKKDQKAEEKKRAEEKRNEKTDHAHSSKSDQTVTVTASSIDELIRKINDTIFKHMSDSARTDMERNVGQRFDFSI